MDGKKDGKPNEMSAAFCSARRWWKVFAPDGGRGRTEERLSRYNDPFRASHVIERASGLSRVLPGCIELNIARCR